MRMIVWLSLMLMGFVAPVAAQAGPVWAVECETGGGSDKCFASHHVLNNGVSFVQLGVGYLGKNNEPTVVARLPVDIALQTPLPVDVDKQRLFNLVPIHCNAAACFASMVLTAKSLDLLKKSQTLAVAFSLFGDTRVITATIPLADFRTAFESLKK